jgi:hypothetical protein
MHRVRIFGGSEIGILARNVCVIVRARSSLRGNRHIGA